MEPTSVERMPPSDRAAEVWQAHPSWGQVPALHLQHGDEPLKRLVVVSAHPDDESLGAGGLIATAHRAGLPIYVVLLTAGEAADPSITDGSHQALARLRLQEMGCAVELLAPGTPVVFLGVQDGQVAQSEEMIAANLTEAVGSGSHTLVLAPWREDPHPDHRAAGRAAARAAAAGGARLLEYPVRLWLDQGPEAAPWAQMVRLDLDEDLSARKARAVACHASQVRPPTAGSWRFEHLTGSVEHYVEVGTDS